MRPTYVLCLCVLLGIVCAQEDPPAQRTIQIQVNQLQLQFQANSQNVTHQDQLQFSIDLGQQNQGVFQSFFQYQSQGTNQTQLKLTIAVAELYEINDTYYKGEAASLVSKWPGAGGVSWNNWINETKTVSDVLVYSFSSTTKDGVFTIRVHISPRNVLDGSVLVSPNDIKMDFEVHNFPYTRNDTRIAMHTKITSNSQSENSGQNAVDNNYLTFATAKGLPFGAFSWDPKVNTTGGLVPIIAWSPNDAQGTYFDIFFSFATEKSNIQPTDLVWDPRVGLDYSAPAFCVGSLCGASAVVVVILIVVVLVVGILLAVVLYRRRKTSYQVIQ